MVELSGKIRDNKGNQLTCGHYVLAKHQTMVKAITTWQVRTYQKRRSSSGTIGILDRQTAVLSVPFGYC